MEYKLKTGDALKCSACGKDKFEEKHKEKEGREKWAYVCENCGHIMSFAGQLKGK